MCVGGGQGVDDGLELVLGDAHVQGAHGFEGANGAVVAARQDRDLAFLSQVGVGAVFGDGGAEHAGGGFAVDVFASCEGCQGAGFSGEPGDDAGFDRGEVSDDEPVTGGGDEGGPHELAEHVGHGRVEQLEGFEVAGAGKLAGLVQVGHVVAGQVVDLDEAACEPAGASCPVELDQAPGAAVDAAGVLHGLVLAD